MELSLEAARFKRDIDELIELYDKRKEESVALGVINGDNLFEIHEEDMEALVRLSKLRGELCGFK
jgi:hypothetical protein